MSSPGACSSSSWATHEVTAACKSYAMTSPWVVEALQPGDELGGLSRVPQAVQVLAVEHDQVAAGDLPVRRPAGAQHGLGPVVAVGDLHPHVQHLRDGDVKGRAVHYVAGLHRV